MLAFWRALDGLKLPRGRDTRLQTNNTRQRSAYRWYIYYLLRFVNLSTFNQREEVTVVTVDSLFSSREHDLLIRRSVRVLLNSRLVITIYPVSC
jgi:hypothetical protein